MSFLFKTKKFRCEHVRLIVNCRNCNTEYQSNVLFSGPKRESNIPPYLVVQVVYYHDQQANQLGLTKTMHFSRSPLNLAQSHQVCHDQRASSSTIQKFADLLIKKIHLNQHRYRSTSTLSQNRHCLKPRSKTLITSDPCFNNQFQFHLNVLENQMREWSSS